MALNFLSPTCAKFLIKGDYQEFVELIIKPVLSRHGCVVTANINPDTKQLHSWKGAHISY